MNSYRIFERIYNRSTCVNAIYTLLIPYSLRVSIEAIEEYMYIIEPSKVPYNTARSDVVSPATVMPYQMPDFFSLPVGHH